MYLWRARVWPTSLKPMKPLPGAEFNRHASQLTLVTFAGKRMCRVFDVAIGIDFEAQRSKTSN
jgi:hypothetical protein